MERITKVGNGFKGGFKIGAPVGDWAKGAKNIPGDVETVQLLLEHVAKKRGQLEFSPRGVDGSISRLPGKSSTVRAILAFQRTFMKSPDGTIEPGGLTLEKLRQEVEGTSSATKSAAKSVMTMPHASDSMPPWLHLFDGLKIFNALSLLPGRAQRPQWVETAEKELGQKEVAGKKHNARIIEYHATTNGAKDDENPWCASFVNWVLKNSGYEGAGSAWSHAWKTWGDGLSKPAVGSVAFIDWGKVDKAKKDKGHVGFVVGKASGDRIVLLGGNQGDQVKYAAFPASYIQAYRVPKGYQPSQQLYELPMMEVSKGGGGFTETR